VSVYAEKDGLVITVQYKVGYSMSKCNAIIRTTLYAVNLSICVTINIAIHYKSVQLNAKSIQECKDLIIWVEIRLKLDNYAKEFSGTMVYQKKY